MILSTQYYCTVCTQSDTVLIMPSKDLVQIVGYVSRQTKARMKTIAENLSKQRGIGRYGESRLVVEAVEYNIAYFEATGRWFHEVYPERKDAPLSLAAEASAVNAPEAAVKDAAAEEIARQQHLKTEYPTLARRKKEKK